MWKIFFVYSDKSKCTITGKSDDITLEQAVNYHNQYGTRSVSENYQKYPKAKNEPKDLFELIEEMQSIEEDEDLAY